MKISKESLKKLGFKKCGKAYWYHTRHQSLFVRGNELTWDHVVDKIFQFGEEYGKLQKVREIKKALSI
jgi:hypothetical protein